MTLPDPGAMVLDAFGKALADTITDPHHGLTDAQQHALLTDVMRRIRAYADEQIGWAEFLIQHKEVFNADHNPDR